jgi:hypothetical protein
LCFGLSLARLLNLRRRFTAGVVQRDFADFGQIEVAPLDRVALFVLDAQIPLSRFLRWIELDLRALARRQSVFAKDVFTPLLFIRRRNVERVDLDSVLLTSVKSCSPALLVCAVPSTSIAPMQIERSFFIIREVRC